MFCLVKKSKQTKQFFPPVSPDLNFRFEGLISEAFFSQLGGYVDLERWIWRFDRSDVLVRGTTHAACVQHKHSRTHGQALQRK